MRVIPPPRTRPRPPLSLLTRSVPPVLRRLPAAVTARGGSRTRPLRGPPEQHPLQNRQVSPQPLQLSRLLRVLRPQPGVLLPEHGILLAQLSNQPRHLPVRLQGRSQHLPQRRLSTLQNRDKTSRNRHAAQQTPSAAANHAPRTTCLTPSAGTTGEPAHHATSEYLLPVSLSGCWLSRQCRPDSPWVAISTPPRDTTFQPHLNLT